MPRAATTTEKLETFIAIAAVVAQRRNWQKVKSSSKKLPVAELAANVRGVTAKVVPAIQAKPQASV